MMVAAMSFGLPNGEHDWADADGRLLSRALELTFGHPEVHANIFVVFSALI
jgi:hypothetical protein